MKENKFQNNKGMVNSNLNTSNMCILFLKPSLYAIVINGNLVCTNVMYFGGLVINNFY
jgi:hypothetical protein